MLENTENGYIGLKSRLSDLGELGFQTPLYRLAVYTGHPLTPAPTPVFLHQ